MLERVQQSGRLRSDARRARLLRVGLSPNERREVDELLAGCRVALEVEDFQSAPATTARAAGLRLDGQIVLILASARLGVLALLDLVSAFGPWAKARPPLTLLAEIGDGLVVEAVRAACRVDWLFSYDLTRETLSRAMELSYERAGRVQLEEDLSRTLEISWRDLAAVLARIDEGVLFIDPQLRVERASRRAAELLGRSQRQLIGLPFTALGWAEPARARSDLSLGEVDDAALMELEDGEGQIRRLRVRVYRLAEDGDSGGVRRMVVLSEPGAQAAPPDDPLTARLTLAVAHDLGNVLTPVLGHAEWLVARLGEDDPASRWAGEIVRSAELAVELVRSLHAAHGRPGSAPESCLADQLVGRLGPLLSALVGSRVRLELSLGAPNGRILARPADLARVLLNLVANARDAIAGDGSIAVVTAPGEAGEWIVEVFDTGAGIAPEEVARIFQAGYSTKGSNGLGLAIVRGLLDEAGAAISVASSAGQGTQIRVVWPGESLRPAGTPTLG